MKYRHNLLAVAVTAIWGFNFVVIRWGLESFPPLFLVALRFAVAASAAAFLPRPALSWKRIIFVGMVWFTAQFSLLFVGMQVGMTAGLASVLMQSQAFLTVVLAVVFLGETASLQQMAGTVVAAAGLAVIAMTVTGSPDDVTLLGLACIMAASTCWAVGNVIVRRTANVDMLAFVTWLSLVPPLSLLLLSLVFEGRARSSRRWRISAGGMPESCCSWGSARRPQDSAAGDI